MRKSDFFKEGAVIYKRQTDLDNAILRFKIAFMSDCKSLVNIIIVIEFFFLGLIIAPYVYPWGY